MAKYKFEDIAINSKLKKKPVEEDKYHYIGLEHLDSGSLEVTRYGSEVAPKGEKLIMKKGDVLFGKRRAYQKKVGIAPFDGIFSAHGMVLRPKENVIDKNFFPLFISSDYFLDAAIKISVGSLSPTINWGDLKELEFELPGLDEQRKLAKILWAAEETKQAYKTLLQKTDDLAKAKFEEMFGANEIKKFNKKPIIEVIEKPISGEWGTDDISGNGIKVLRTTNFTDYGTIDYGDVITRNIEGNKIKNKLLEDCDIIIEKSGGSDTKPVGRVVYYKDNNELYLVNNFTAILRKKEENINSDYLFYFLYNAYWNGKTRLFENKTTGIHNLKLQEYLSNTNIAIPPLNLQEQFSKIFNNAEQSKQQLQKSLDSLNAMMKALINENLK